MKSRSSKIEAQLLSSQQKYDDNIKLINNENNKRLSDKDNRISELNEKVDELGNEVKELTSKKTQAETEKSAIQEKLNEQAVNLENQFQQMKEQFKNIANDVIKGNSSDISKMGADTIKSIIDPFKEQMVQFREKVDKCYVDEKSERFSLKEEIKRLVEANQKIGEDANNLATALKGNSKIQGDWGEMILDDILSKSGLKEGVHYHRQEYTRDSDGNIINNDEGGSMRTDVIVDFPDNRKMIIDSKVSLTAYSNYVNADDSETADRALKEHLKSVTDHINELSNIDYSKYISEAPDFVMMFIPNEPAYYLVLQANPNIWNYAYDRKVVLINPTNLITALRLSLDLWRRDDQIKNLDKIVRTATSLYEKVSLFKDSMEKIGSGLGALSDTYDVAMSRFSSGKGNVLTLTQKLTKFGITPKRVIVAKNDENDDEETDE